MSLQRISGFEFLSTPESILNPSLFIAGIEWREPMTSVTDFMIAITAFYGFLLLRRWKGDAGESLRYYQQYFLMFAIGMTFAAWFGHALQAYVAFEWKMVGWICSLSGQTFLAFASLTDVRKGLGEKKFHWIKLAILVLFSVFLIWILSPLRSFTAAQTANGVFAVGLVVPLQLYQYFRYKRSGNLIILGAIAYGLFPSLIYNQQISLHRWFNYHDISHVLLCGFMLMMIFGVRKIQHETVERISDKT